MKKFFLLVPVAALAMTACTSESNEFVGDSQQQAMEITFSPLTQKATRTPVASTTFSTTDNFKVAAYLASGTGATPADFFQPTTFSYDAGSGTWKGSRYWPISTATLNFLAVTQTAGGVESRITPYFGTGATTSADGSADYASNAVVSLTGNNAFNQADLMYAAGQASSSQATGSNAIMYGNNVALQFQHALAWINFKVQTSTTGVGAPTITVNSITLNNAEYNGTYTISNTNYAATGSINWSTLTGTWTYDNTDSKINQVVPKADGSAAADAVVLNGSPADFGNGLLVIPDAGADGFTINYTIEQGGKQTTYDYTYTFSDAEKTWVQRMKYIYAIDITLTEITIAPSVAEWGDGGTTNVNIPSFAIGTNYSFNIPAAAGNYTFTMTGLTSDPTVTYDTGSASFPSAPTKTYASTVATFKFKVDKNDSGSDNEYKIVVTDEGSSKVSTITINQAH